MNRCRGLPYATCDPDYNFTIKLIHYGFSTTTGVVFGSGFNRVSAYLELSSFNRGANYQTLERSRTVLDSGSACGHTTRRNYVFLARSKEHGYRLDWLNTLTLSGRPVTANSKLAWAVFWGTLPAGITGCLLAS